MVDGRGLTTDELKGADIAQSLSQDICFGAGSLERLKICVPTFLGVDSAIAMITALRDKLGERSLQQLSIDTQIPWKTVSCLGSMDVKDLRLTVFNPRGPNTPAKQAETSRSRGPAVTTPGHHTYQRPCRAFPSKPTTITDLRRISVAACTWTSTLPDLRCLAIDGPAFVNVAEFAHLSNLTELAISSRVDEELLQAVMQLSQLRVHRLPSICLTAAQFSALCESLPEFQELVMDELRLSALLAAQRASSIKRITVRRGLHLTRPPPVQQAGAQEHVEQGTVCR